MTLEKLISWLIHSDWFFLASWIVLLVGAFAFTFAERSGSADSSAPRDTPPAS